MIDFVDSLDFFLLSEEKLANAYLGMITVIFSIVYILLAFHLRLNT